MWDQVLTPRRSAPHMLAQRWTRANNHLQTRTESLLSLEHQTLKICRQEQLRFLSTGVPWQNKTKVEHWGLQTEYPRDGKIIHEGLYI